MGRVVVPLPDRDFDITEVAVPWRVLTDAGHDVTFATRSVLDGRRTTCLTRWQEGLAYGLTWWKLGRYYRTYPAYVQDEVTRALGPDGRFERGPFDTKRGTATDDGPAFVVVDGRYVSARWPGDAYRFAAT